MGSLLCRFAPLVLLAVIATPALAESAPVTRCDELAANRLDSDRPPAVAGTTVPEITKAGADAALAACKEAIARYPTERRFKYQLGRAYHAASRFSEALPAYMEASDLGSTAAMFNLGNMYFRGDGVERDFVAARSWYERSGERGAESAETLRVIIEVVPKMDGYWTTGRCDIAEQVNAWTVIDDVIQFKGNKETVLERVTISSGNKVNTIGIEPFLHKGRKWTYTVNDDRILVYDERDEESTVYRRCKEE